jgi:hypothetical protein
MGLKKRSLSLLGRSQLSTERYRDQELVACGLERHTKKGLGFFGHVTEQVSGWCVMRSDGQTLTTLLKSKHFAQILCRLEP